MSARRTTIFAMMKNVARGTMGFIRALPFALEHGLWWAFVVPVLLWVGLTYGLFVVLQGPVDQLAQWVALRFSIPVDPTAQGLAATWNGIKAVLNGARELVVSAMLKLAIAYLLFTFNKYLVLILLSPLLAYVSERTQTIITGVDQPFNLPHLIKDVWRGVLIALRNGTMELLITIAVWIGSIVFPVTAPFAFILLFFVSAYFYGFSMFDYVFERRRLRVGASVRAVNDRMGMVLANGALFSLLMRIPLMGMCLAPVMAAIGAVLALEKAEDPQAS